MQRYLSCRLLMLPLALRNALPAYGNEIILMDKATSLASVITLMDVTGIAYRLISESYRAGRSLGLTGPSRTGNERFAHARDPPSYAD